MSADDFFKEVDKKIDSINEAKTKDKNSALEVDIFMKKAIQDFMPTLQTYVDKVEERGIKCECRSNELSFSFMLFYKDGGKNGLTFGQDFTLNSGAFIFKGHSTNDDGKNFTSTDGSPISQNNWSLEDAEKRVQRTINDFLFYADRHGGC
jgi:hypothetical protein